MESGPSLGTIDWSYKNAPLSRHPKPGSKKCVFLCMAALKPGFHKAFKLDKYGKFLLDMTPNWMQICDIKAAL